MKESIKFDTVGQYLSTFPASTKRKLIDLQKAIRKAAPGADEEIAYNMPAYKLQGPLVYFAGYDKHIGFYPMPSAIEVFKKELSGYKGAKGSVQFPLDQPLPLPLITKIVKFRVKENVAMAKEKAKKKKR